MTIELSSFRSLASDSGYIHSSGKNDIKLSGTGVFGKIREWVRSFDKTGNTNVKNNFLNSLKMSYGQDFLNNPALKKLIGNDPAERLSAKPLSARTVRDIIAIGDQTLINKAQQKILQKPQPVSARESQKTLSFSVAGKAVSVISSHANQADIHANAQRFIHHNTCQNGSSDLLKGLINYINSSDTNESSAWEQLKQLPGSESTLSFARAFKIKDETTKLPSMDLSAVDPGAQDPVKMRTIQSAAGLCALQISSRMKMMADALLTAKNADRASFAANEILEKTSLQIKTLSDAQALMSDVKTIDKKCLTPAAAQDFVRLKETIDTQLGVLRDPNGIFQTLIAFAADVAINPNEGYKTIQAMQSH
jgi:hypothetical protein